MTYLCLADEKQKRRIPFLFLAEVKDRFRATYGDRAKTAIAFAMNTEFARVLSDRMEYFNENPGADNFGKVKDQLTEVKDIMVENIGALTGCTLFSCIGCIGVARRVVLEQEPLLFIIIFAFVMCYAEKVLARGEKIELLVDKTDQLNQSAKKFQKSSKQLKNVMWWKNIKMWMLITIIVLVLIWLISSFVCGFDYSKCGAGGS